MSVGPCLRQAWAWLRATPRLRRCLVGLGLVVTLPWLGLVVLALLQPLPTALETARYDASVRVLDRDGQLLHELRARDGRAAEPVRLAEVAPELVVSLIAAEDARFFWHVGVDPLAMLRAGLQALFNGRIVSGASTLTQQLARTLAPRPRTVKGKILEMALALRIDAAYDKRRILEEYLSRVEFAPGRVGVEAASRALFDKPAKALDLSESALLVAQVKSPSFYDVHRKPERARARRDWVLSRLARTHEVAAERIERARSSAISVRRSSRLGGALHLALGLARTGFIPELRGERAVAIRSTLDSALQRDVEGLARAMVSHLEDVEASALAALVVDNDSGEVRAHVGSPDYFATSALGSNDGTVALRQPGSLLKPFVYAAAFEQLQWDGSTLLPDLSLTLSTPQGAYQPKNYDGREHGPVRLRMALANSLNLPALHAAERVGPARVLEMLRRFGFASLERDALHYGAAIALGDGEVRLSEVAAAFASLARGGRYRPLRYADRAWLASGAEVELATKPERAVLEPSIAEQLTDILADNEARIAMFGRDSALEFPFPVAAKTGTSKGYRDNWAVGYTREVTVAVWVGNFDARPLVRSSGVSGAGPLLHQVLLRAMQGKAPAPLVRPGLLRERPVCALSGASPTASCPVRVLERFALSRAPREPCTLHVTLHVDPVDGSLTAPQCPGAVAAVFERYPERYRDWAKHSGRKVLPDRVSARCRAARTTEGGDGLRRNLHLR